MYAHFYACTACFCVRPPSNATSSTAMVFTPSKPSTAYAQRTAGGKTPSIYSLIKKNSGLNSSSKSQSYPKPPPYRGPTGASKNAKQASSFFTLRETFYTFYSAYS